MAKPKEIFNYKKFFPPEVDTHDYDDVVFDDYNASTVRNILIELHGDKCYYCDGKFDGRMNESRSRTIDHFHSKVYCVERGWEPETINGIRNLVLAHKVCNSDKSHRYWQEDGMLEPKKNVKPEKKPRPEACEHCMNGRLLNLGETCPICDSGPKPDNTPRSMQKSPKECDHSEFHCWECHLGFVERVKP